VRPPWRWTTVCPVSPAAFLVEHTPLRPGAHCTGTPSGVGRLGQPCRDRKRPLQVVLPLDRDGLPALASIVGPGTVPA